MKLKITKLARKISLVTIIIGFISCSKQDVVPQKEEVIQNIPELKSESEAKAYMREYMANQNFKYTTKVKVLDKSSKYFVNFEIYSNNKKVFDDQLNIYQNSSLKIINNADIVFPLSKQEVGIQYEETFQDSSYVAGDIPAPHSFDTIPSSLFNVNEADVYILMLENNISDKGFELQVNSIRNNEKSDNYSHYVYVYNRIETYTTHFFGTNTYGYLSAEDNGIVFKTSFRRLLPILPFWFFDRTIYGNFSKNYGNREMSFFKGDLNHPTWIWHLKVWGEPIGGSFFSDSKYRFNLKTAPSIFPN